MKSAGCDPQVVGRYAIHQEIASGAMGSVRFARLAGPAGFSRTVAVKLPHHRLAEDSDFAPMFLDEARLAARIRHPNVVSILDVIQTECELALVMDYVHGEALSKLDSAAKKRNERIPLGIAASVVIDTLHGLHAAHEAKDDQGEPLGIVHRDVSPQNVLVGVDGIARLVDFGIAKAAGRLQHATDVGRGEVKGKLAYMAPEQARGESVSRVTDIFAAGIVFWELLTGERLFLGRTEAESLHRVLVSRIRPPRSLAPDLPATLDTILMKALSRDPAGRYQTAREMALDIEACVPPVRPSEIGSWVERMAADTLSKRSAALLDIERGSKEPCPECPECFAAEPAPKNDPPPRSRWPERALAALGLVALLVSLGRAGISTRPSPGPGGAALVQPPPSAKLAGSARPAEAAPVASTSDSSPSPPPAASAQPSVSASHDARVARPGPRPPRVASPKVPGRCDPPYSIDSRGREIFKPECM
jgi:eukaryotic-like serine/threonine-protein kinase